MKKSHLKQYTDLVESLLDDGLFEEKKNIEEIQPR
jgi:hypothetical protein